MDFEQWAVLQIKWTLRFDNQPLLQHSLVPLRCVMLFKIDRRLLKNLLHRLAIAIGKGGTQRSMTINQCLERTSQAVHIQTAANARSKGEVIRRIISRELVQKPERLLAAGKRLTTRGRIARERISIGRIKVG